MYLYLSLRTWRYGYATIKAEEKQLLDAFFETVEIIDVDTQVADIAFLFPAHSLKQPCN